jgi:hypothetical protein
MRGRAGRSRPRRCRPYSGAGRRRCRRGRRARGSPLRRSDAPPAECEQGYDIALHPALQRFLTPGDPCGTTGTTGAWNAITGTHGWDRVAFDLTAYAGQEMEVVVSYVTDPAFGGQYVYVDDVELTVDGVTEVEDFESSIGAWTVPGPPADSPGNATDWEWMTYSPSPAAVATPDTLMFGFGFEGIDTDEQRAALMGAALSHLLD